MDRKGRRKKILILCFMFLCTGLVSFAGLREDELQPKEYKLLDFPHNLNGWFSRNVNISEKVVQALELDDLLSRVYRKVDREVEVYVGYYYSAKKVGKSHSPLVCLPGQGRNIYDIKYLKLRIGPNDKFLLNVKTLIAEDTNSKIFVLFWYQAYDKAFHRTFIQKLTVAYNKIINHKTDSAFMRVIVSIDSEGDVKALSTAEEFLNDFYPEFINFVKS